MMHFWMNMQTDLRTRMGKGEERYEGEFNEYEKKQHNLDC